MAVPAVAADGSTRLVVVGTADLVGGVTLLGRAAIVFLIGAVLASVVVALAAWIATRAALRPVDRMRLAAAALPPGERLPVPVARDELRALAEEINRLLARRDDAVARLERFTGDAAHELRSPVAAIRAQAEVAVAHPDPELAAETLRAVVDESDPAVQPAVRPARAGPGRRRAASAGRSRSTWSPRPRAAIARCATDEPDRPVLQLVAPTPAQVAATPVGGGAGAGQPDRQRAALRPLGGADRRCCRPGSGCGWSSRTTGPASRRQDRQRVFDRFVRLSPEAGGGGAGLGLALVAALVQGRGGTATAGAAPSGGARVEVRWRTP